MTVIQKQELFCRMVARLIDRAVELGFQPRLGHAWREPNSPVGHPRSCHKMRLAIDLLLDRDGVYLNKSEDYTELGEWWESQHEYCRWGGRFNVRDGNHFSFEHNGVS